jgi:hypothetical protein
MAALGTLLLLVAGCAGQRAEVRGRTPSGPAIAVARLASLPANGTVTVRGTMVEK